MFWRVLTAVVGGWLVVLCIELLNRGELFTYQGEMRGWVIFGLVTLFLYSVWDLTRSKCMTSISDYDKLQYDLEAAQAQVKELERYNGELKYRLAQLREAAQRFIEMEPEKDGKPNVDFYDMKADLRYVLYVEEDCGAQWGL